MKTSAGLMVVALLGLGVGVLAHAGASPSPWCKVKAQAASNGASQTTEFAWDGAHGGVQSTGPIKTSIGTLDRGEGADATTAILLDGKLVPLPPAATGVIWNGKVFDFGDKIAVVFLVETATDSSASPSEALVLIGKGPRVLEQGAISGQETSPNRCPLL